MSTITPINSLPVPDDNSPNDPPIHFGALAVAVDDKLNSRFISTATRDAAIPTPAAGMECWVSGIGKQFNTNGTIAGWVTKFDNSASPTVDLIGAASAVAGSLPASYVPKIQAGTVLVATNSSALGQFSWPVSFPAGVISVQLTSLTDSVPQLRLVGGGGVTAARCQIVARNADGTPAVNLNVSVSYLAVGW